MIELLFALSVEVAPVCPQIERRPVGSVAALPGPIAQRLGPMADPGQDWNAGDVIRPEDRRPLARLIAAGQLRDGRWLVVHESGGRTVQRHLDVFEETIEGGVAHPMSLSGSSVDRLCAQAADLFDGRGD